jgi:hypothetical protein
MEEVKGVQETSPSPLAEAIASSPEVIEAIPVPETENVTPQQTTPEPVEPKEEGRIPYSRFKDVVEEKNWLKQQLEMQLQQRQPAQQPTQDPEAGMTAEERVFWQRQRAIAREEAMKVSQEQMGQIRPVIDAGRMELAQMKVLQFRKDHPDIKPNSPEEMDIAQRINQGYTPDDAYWATVGPRGFKVATEQVKQQAKQQIVAKKMANVDTSTSINTPKSFDALRPIPTTKAEIDEQRRSSRAKFRAEFEARLAKEPA